MPIAKVKQHDLPRQPLPFNDLSLSPERTVRFVSDDDRVLKNIALKEGGTADSSESFEKAGLRNYMCFDPAKVHAAIVTCGGLCPGLNDVMRSIVLTLHHWYRVKKISGIRYGYGGLSKNPLEEPISLTPEVVSDIHREGGTLLASSRGFPPMEEVVDSIERMEIDLLFCIGGDGTLRGTHEISEACDKRGLKVSVVGIPKTIDNDIQFVFNSFGFQTAVEESKRVLDAAHVEALGAFNGVGLVKLMGRDAGFIAADATRASGDVNFCLVPEIDFPLDGENGFLQRLRERLEDRKHAVVVVAEGAGGHLVGDGEQRDGSGNLIHKDIGAFLKSAIKDQFKEWDVPVSVKYFDPSYLIRSVPADSEDSVFCAQYGRFAAHAAMSGRTDLMIGFWHGEFTHVPLSEIHGKKKNLDMGSQFWRDVLACTAQPLEW